MRLALPALGALAAEPLYVLGDTAIVGHVSTEALAGLALGGLLLAETLGFVTVLEYGATAKVSRLYGAGQRRDALDVGVQATWFALGLGLLAAVVIEALADPALRLLAGGATPAYEQGLIWLRIAALGAPFVLVTAAGQGWMRGFQDTRTPFAVLGIANLASICLSLVLVQGVGLGIEGSAIANVVAQVASGATFVILLIRRGAPLAPSLVRIRGQMRAARDLALRTASFFAAFTTAAAVAAAWATRSSPRTRSGSSCGSSSRSPSTRSRSPHRRWSAACSARATSTLPGCSAGGCCASARSSAWRSPCCSRPATT